MRRLSAVLLAVFLAGPAAAAQDGAVGLKEQGRRALQERRFREAATHLDAAARSLPNDIEVHVLVGRAYWGEDRPYPISAPKAIAAFARAVALDTAGNSPVGLDALQQLALTCVRNERLLEARAAYAKLVARVTDQGLKDRYLTQIDEIDLDRGVYTPPSLALRNPRGDVLAPVGPLRMRTNRWFEKGRHTQDPVKQAEYFLRATETDPAMHQGWLNAGVGFMNQGRYREAIPLLRHAVDDWRLEHRDGAPYIRAHTWLLRCHVELGELDPAREQWLLLAKAPLDNWAVLMRLRLVIAEGRPQEAIPALESGAAEDPEHVEVLYTLALAYAGAGRYPAAVAALERAIAAIPPGHPHFTHRLGDLAARLETWRRQARPE